MRVWLLHHHKTTFLPPFNFRNLWFRASLIFILSFYQVVKKKFKINNNIIINKRMVKNNPSLLSFTNSHGKNGIILTRTHLFPEGRTMEASNYLRTPKISVNFLYHFV